MERKLGRNLSISPLTRRTVCCLWYKASGPDAESAGSHASGDPSSQRPVGISLRIFFLRSNIRAEFTPMLVIHVENLQERRNEEMCTYARKSVSCKMSSASSAFRRMFMTFFFTKGMCRLQSSTNASSFPNCAAVTKSSSSAWAHKIECLRPRIDSGRRSEERLFILSIPFLTLGPRRLESTIMEPANLVYVTRSSL